MVVILNLTNNAFASLFYRCSCKDGNLGCKFTYKANFRQYKYITLLQKSERQENVYLTGTLRAEKLSLVGRDAV
jgi:hypothetical protein